ncbi:MAG: 50S ribosomal protein L25 [Anaerolineae bacterium]|nr:50S ribosomal protein L25 [Anaerolineae bacterium]
MADMLVLEAAKRDVLGKQVRHLRKEGIIPGVLYGPTIEAIPLQMKWTELRPLLRAAGGSSVIEVAVSGGETYNALVRDVQRHPLRGDVLHVDFYRVRMDVVIRTDVPVVTVGSDLVIAKKGGVISQEMTTVTVECLPGNLPSHIEVDISGMTEIGETILAVDLPQIEGVTYLVNDDDTIVSSSYLERAPEAEEEEIEGDFDGSAEPELVRDEDDDFDDEV